MWLLILFFLFVVLVTGSITFIAYRLLRQRFRWTGPPLAMAWILALVFLFPIPIHGGFMLSGELILDGLEEWRETRTERKRELQTQKFEERLRDETRFRNPATFRILDGGTPWFRVATGFGEVAHLHRPSGLVFTDPFPWQPDGEVTWEKADARCRELPPGDAWALPDQADLYLFWRDRGMQVSPWGNGQFVSVLHDTGSGLSLTVLHAGPGPQLLRCVTRDPAAPGTRFSRADIPLAEWNRFQLDAGRYR